MVSDEKGGLMKKRLSLKKWFILFLMFTLLSNLRAEHFPWPDFDHWRHGFPCFWLTHQTSSIAGPVDRWYFDLMSLLANMIFWASIALVLACVLEQKRQKDAGFEARRHTF